MRLDSIFKALGIETMDDIERLTAYFIIGETKGSHVANLHEGEETAQKLIHPNDVVRSIRTFVDESRMGGKTRKLRARTKSQDHEDEARKFLLMVALAEISVDNVPQATKMRNLQKEYWERMSNVISEKNYRTWTVK